MNATPSAQGSAELVLADIRREFPAFRIVAKRQSLLSTIVHGLLVVVTLGGQRRYLSDYHTVIGSTLFVADSWESLPDVDRTILLLHERVHLRQARRLTPVGMAFVYLIPLFPLGLAYGRARLEWEAYIETIRATAERKGLEAARTLRPGLIRRFCSADYGWMWPFPVTVNRWYDRVIAQIEAEIGAKSSAKVDAEHPRTTDELREDS